MKKNPVDAFLEMEKAGGLWDAMKGIANNPLGKPLVQGASQTAGALAVAGIGAAAAGIYQAVAKRREFKEMLETDPTLRERQAENPDRFNAIYSSLRNIAPVFGRDPLIAAAHMHKFLDSPGQEGLMLAGTVATPRPETPSQDLGFYLDAPITSTLRYQRDF